jgi:hypothetical protein
VVVVVVEVIAPSPSCCSSSSWPVSEPSKSNRRLSERRHPQQCPHWHARSVAAAAAAALEPVAVVGVVLMTMKWQSACVLWRRFVRRGSESGRKLQGSGQVALHPLLDPQRQPLGAQQVLEAAAVVVVAVLEAVAVEVVAVLEAAAAVVVVVVAAPSPQVAMLRCDKNQ